MAIGPERVAPRGIQPRGLMATLGLRPRVTGAASPGLRRPRLTDAPRPPAARAARRPGHVLERAERRARDPVLDLLGASSAGDPVVLALEVPADGGLEGLLVGTGPPAELPPRFGRAVGPPLARSTDLLRAERRAR